MSQVTIEIGGRSFDVVCQEGEESYLKTAAAMLDQEAQKLESAGSRITESRMLLMAGLLLADRTAASEEKLTDNDSNAFSDSTNSEIMEHASKLEAKLKEVEAELSIIKAQNITPKHDNINNELEITALKQEKNDAEATIQLMIDRVKSLI
ncbi:cell division protein ZapA [Amylibacter sp.]|nr:cell division protein ZapA [Amylibacter sp.]MDB9875786.1 cell division protein ZapA [Amylibacter sp.]MDC1497732.1 cell division protein ZapA [Amylibacter sp.]